MDAALIERNILEERKEYYIDRLVAYFKNSHIDKENAATIVKMLDGYKNRLSATSQDYIYRNFIRQSCSILQDIIKAKIHSFDTKTGVSVWIPLIDLGHKEFLPYCYKDDVSLEDTAAIYIMADPEIINCSFIDEYKHILIDCDFIKEFYFILDLLKSGVAEGKLKAANSFLTYRNFLLQYSISLYEIEGWLEGEKIIDSRHDAIKIIKAHENKASLNSISTIDNVTEQTVKTSNYTTDNSTEKNSGQKQKKINNLLKLVYYMAEDKYGHEEGEEQDTANKLQTISGNSAQTIKGWLEDACFLIQNDK